MTTSNDSLNFFVLEAGECLERLDANLAGAGPSGPDAAEFVRHARTLRGAALMHRLPGMADLAGAVERAGRAMRDGSIRWSPAVAAALVAAVDDLKILLHNLRIRGPNEEARATRRLADLARLVPPDPDRPHTPIPHSGSSEAGVAFLAREAADTAAALEAVAASPPDGQTALETALGHVRTLRGVAAVHDMPPIPDVLDAVDRAARAITAARSAPTNAQTALFGAAAALLRRTAKDLGSLGHPERHTSEELRFQAACDALAASGTDADHILPISELFYGGDAEALVSRAPSPPTTPADRFRLEVVSLAEHLRGLVRDAQTTGSGRVTDRAVVELRGALLSVRNAAESFGEDDVSEFIGTFTEGHPVFDFLTLNAIDDLAVLLTQPTDTAAGLSARMAELARGRAVDAGIGHGLRSPTEAGSDAPIAQPTRTAAPSSSSRPALETAPRAEQPHPVSRDRVRTPTGGQLQAMLADGIARFADLGDLPLIDQTEPLSSPSAAEDAAETPSPNAPGPEATSHGDQSVVPIETLLYRGESALARARTLRDSLRKADSPAPDSLAELYDLLDLATAS